MRTLTLLFLIVITFSCTRPDPDPDPNPKTELLPFTVTVVERNPTTAIIQWTAGTNNPSGVKYKVVLDGNVVETNLDRRVDTLVNLSANLAYRGSVCVYTPAGDSVFAHFTLNKLSSDPRPLKPFTVTVVDWWSNMAVIEWEESTNSYDSETVKYDVLLGGQIVHSGLTSRRDTLRDLHIDSVYAGKVLAYTAAGDTASATFQFQRINGLMYFGAGNSGMLCYNIYTGDLVWKSEESTDEFLNMPIIEDNVLYVTASISGGTGTFAFDAKTGQRLWRTALPGSFAARTNISIKNGIVYCVLSSGIYALNKTTGQVLWSYTPENRTFGHGQVVDGNLLFVTATATGTDVSPVDRRIVAFDLNAQLPVWEKETAFVITTSPLVHNGLLIYGGSDGKVIALNQADGTVNWTRNFGHGPRFEWLSPVVHGNTVFVHDFITDRLYALSTQTGATVWKYDNVLDVSSATIGNGIIYFTTSSNDKLYAINVSTGTPLWARDAFVVPENYLMIVKDRIYLSLQRGFSVHNATNGEFIRLFETFRGAAHNSPPAIVVDGITYYPAESGMKQ